MGIKLDRKKPRNFFVTLIYRIQNLLPISSKAKMKIFLNLEWIFHRLSHEMSFKIYSPDKHPVRKFSMEFLLSNINKNSVVLDLGCNLGVISNFIAEKAKEVVGVDYLSYAIDLAKQNYKRDNLSFYNEEAISYLNKSNKKFDTLILSHILEHLDEPKKFLLDFKSYFDQIYIEVPDFDRYYLNHYRKDMNLDLIYADEDHVSEFDRKELKELVTECGLEVIKEEYRYGVQKLWCRVT